MVKRVNEGNALDGRLASAALQAVSGKTCWQGACCGAGMMETPVEGCLANSGHKIKIVTMRAAGRDGLRPACRMPAREGCTWM
jgi:hypothetical protein